MKRMRQHSVAGIDPVYSGMYRGTAGEGMNILDAENDIDTYKAKAVAVIDQADRKLEQHCSLERHNAHQGVGELMLVGAIDT